MTPTARSGGRSGTWRCGSGGALDRQGLAHGVFTSGRRPPRANTVACAAPRPPSSRGGVRRGAGLTDSRAPGGAPGPGGRRRPAPEAPRRATRRATGGRGRAPGDAWAGSGRRTGRAGPGATPRRWRPAPPPPRRRTRARWPGRREQAERCPEAVLAGIGGLPPRRRRAPRRDRRQATPGPARRPCPGRPRPTSRWPPRPPPRPAGGARRAAKRGATPVRRTGVGGRRPGAASASSRPASSTTSAGVR